MKNLKPFLKKLVPDFRYHLVVYSAGENYIDFVRKKLEDIGVQVLSSTPDYLKFQSYVGRLGGGGILGIGAVSLASFEIKRVPNEFETFRIDIEQITIRKIFLVIGSTVFLLIGIPVAIKGHIRAVGFILLWIYGLGIFGSMGHTRELVGLKKFFNALKE